MLVFPYETDELKGWHGRPLSQCQSPFDSGFFFLKKFLSKTSEFIQVLLFLFKNNHIPYIFVVLVHSTSWFSKDKLISYV